MRAFFVVIALSAAQPALAQTQAPQASAPSGRPADAGAGGWSMTVGAGLVLSPAWQGSRDMAFSIFPDLRLNYKDVIFASIPSGLGWNIVNQAGWKAGPLAKVRFGRDEDGRGSPFLVSGTSDALRGLGDVDAAAELGGFVEKQFGPLRARAEVRRGFGGHEGVVADGSLAYQARTGRTIISIGPRATIASRRYVATYFGIDPIQSQRSGLRAYAPSGGLVSYGIGGSVVRPLNRTSALTLFTALDRLSGDAGNSPLVRERGRREQFTFGIGYGLRFGL